MKLLAAGLGGVSIVESAGGLPMDPYSLSLAHGILIGGEYAAIDCKRIDHFDPEDQLRTIRNDQSPASKSPVMAAPIRPSRNSAATVTEQSASPPLFIGEPP